MYRYELHMHSAEGSACAHSGICDMVRAYHAAGYAGAVLTDHFVLGNTAIPRDLPWRERMQGYYDVYLKAKPLADELDFDLIFGIEHFYSDCKEILVYGITLEFLQDNPDIPDISVQEFGRRIHEAGGFISHAHPYRDKDYIPDPTIPPTIDMIDAVEVFNYSDPAYTNDKAEVLAAEHGFLRTSGGDTHVATAPSVGHAGMAFPYRVRTGEELVKALRSGDGVIIAERED